MKAAIQQRSRAVKFILACLMLIVLTGCKRELFAELTEREANDMLAILQKSGLDVEKQPGKKSFVRLLVNKSQMADAVNILKSYGYPREEFLGICDIFEKNSMISSPLEERVRFVCAIQQGLSETLSQLDGVITARVHVVMPEKGISGEETVPSSASVFIKYSSDVNLQAFIPQIKLLINNSIEGLDYGKISVALFPAEVYSTDAIKVADTNAEGGRNSKRMTMAIAALAVVMLGSLAINGLLLMSGKRA
ncbi:MAG: type III secretion inner membrane ring lipoprotein SctJ [Gammaproteobacteria bacterium]